MTPRRRPVRRASLAVLWVSACACAGGSPLPDSTVDPPVSVDRIRDAPEAFVGQRVRLTAAVAAQQDDRVFTLKDHDPAFKEQMLVITTQPLPRLLDDERPLLRPDEKLLVTGVIHHESLSGLEVELGVRLDERLRARFEGTPVLVATEVVRTDDREPEPPDTAPGY